MEYTTSSAPPPGSAITRRELLNYAWLASLGILAVNAAGISLYFAMPRPGEGKFGGIIKVGPVSDLPAKDEAPVNYPAGKFWLVHTAEGLVALYKVCTHLDCLFNWDEQEEKFVCPCHGSQFDRTGAYLSGPAPRSLDRFVIQVVSPEGEILVQTDPQTGAALPTSRSSEQGGTRLQASNLLPASGEISEIPSASPAENLPEFEDEAVVQVDTGLKITGRPVA